MSNYILPYNFDYTILLIHDAPKTSTLKSPKVNSGFGSPSDLKSSVKGTAGRGRGKLRGIAPPKTQNCSFQSNKDVPSKKNKGQGNLCVQRDRNNLFSLESYGIPECQLLLKSFRFYVKLNQHTVR